MDTLSCCLPNVIKMATYPNNNYKNQYGMLHVHSERIIKQAIADAGLLSEDPDQKIIILKEAHVALTEEMTKLGEELSRIAGRLMRQHLRKIVSEKDIKNALKVYKRSLATSTPLPIPRLHR